MKAVIPVLWVLLASNSFAEQFEFRGDFVETYTTAPGFTTTLPSEVKLDCIRPTTKGGKMMISHCAPQKIARVYVFENAEEEIWVWSADSTDVLWYDEARFTEAFGKKGYIIYYDEHKQLIGRSHVSFEEDEALAKRIREEPAPTTTEINREMYKIEKQHDKELKGRFKKESEKNYKNTRRPSED